MLYRTGICLETPELESKFFEWYNGNFVWSNSTHIEKNNIGEYCYDVWFNANSDNEAQDQILCLQDIIFELASKT